MAKVIGLLGLLLLVQSSIATYIDRGGRSPFAHPYLGPITKVLHKLLMPNSTDAVLMFDTSSGINRRTFNVMKNLCLAALDCLDQQIKNTRIAVLSFGSTVKKLMNFGVCRNKECLSQLLKRIRMTNSPARALGQALKYSRRLFRKHGKRPNRIVVLVTYGASNKGRGAKVIARKLKKNNKAEIFVIGIGANAISSRNELSTIAGSSSVDDKSSGHLYLMNEERFFIEMSATTRFVRRACST